MSEISRRLDRLSPKQKALLELRLRRAGSPAPRKSPVERIPLSAGQRRLWFFDRLAPENPVYNEPLLAVDIRGSIDRDALKRSINTIVERHEALRTTFPSDATGPYQRVWPPSPIPIVELDLSTAGDLRDDRLRELAREEARRPFNLNSGPLVRVTLLNLGSNHAVLFIAMHHIVSDGWTLRVLLKEIASLYEAYSRGMPSPLPDLPMQYADYAIWQNQRLVGAEFDRLANYWKKRLAPPLPRLQLSFDRPRPPVQRFRGSTEGTQISGSLAAKLREVARRNNCTLFMVILGAFLTLLTRIGGSHDMIIGTAVANRTHPGLEDLIGFFVNVLVLRIDLSGNPQFSELLNRIRMTLLEAFDHQDLPFDRLVEIVKPDRTLAHQPLFDVMAVHHNFPVRSYQTGSLELERLDVSTGDAKFDLVLMTVEVEEGAVEAQLNYDIDLFEASTIRRMLRSLFVLLEAVAEGADLRLGRFNLVSPDDLAAKTAQHRAREVGLLQELQSARDTRSDFSKPK